MAGGGKGGSQSTSVKIPAWLETAAQKNLARADSASQIGYTPYYGPDVAAMTPMQVQAMQGTNAAAGAFGLGQVDPMAGMPQAQTYAGGVQGYGSQPLYQGSLDALQAAAPGQFAALQSPFINQQTGVAQSPSGQTAVPGVQQSRGAGNGYSAPMVQNTGPGYTGLADMINGGGAGASGAEFQGGPLSNTLNSFGVTPRGSSGGSSGMGGGK